MDIVYETHRNNLHDNDITLIKPPELSPSLHREFFQTSQNLVRRREGGWATTPLHSLPPQRLEFPPGLRCPPQPPQEDVAPLGPPWLRRRYRRRRCCRRCWSHPQAKHWERGKSEQAQLDFLAGSLSSVLCCRLLRGGWYRCGGCGSEFNGCSGWIIQH